MDDEQDITYHWRQWLDLLHARLLRLSADGRQAELEIEGWSEPQWVAIPPMIRVPRSVREVAHAAA